MASERKSVFLSIETGNPPLRRPTDFAADFVQRVGQYPESVRRRIPTIYERSGIDYRFSCIDDFGTTPDEFNFFPKNWSLTPEPSTAARNRKYREQSVPLAEDVARRALASSGCTPSEITHVIAVSCTGSFTPGVDIELVRRLGLRPSTSRTAIGFMGCYAAFNAMRVSDAFCRAQPDARVLVVCVELCTLHFRVGETMEDAVISSLFSDGAAAFVMGSLDADDASGHLAYAGGSTALDDDSLDYMTWDIGDLGFTMGLSARVPQVVASLAPGVVDALLQDGGKSRADVDFWAIHPGGRAIVDQASESLGLSPADVSDSLEVLRNHGNMSSPTTLFVLKRFFDRHHSLRSSGRDGLRLGVAMGFGPGLTLEACIVERV